MAWAAHLLWKNIFFSPLQLLLVSKMSPWGIRHECPIEHQAVRPEGRTAMELTSGANKIAFRPRMPLVEAAMEFVQSYLRIISRRHPECFWCTMSNANEAEARSQEVHSPLYFILHTFFSSLIEMNFSCSLWDHPQTAVWSQTPLLPIYVVCEISNVIYNHVGRSKYTHKNRNHRANCCCLRFSSEVQQAPG